MKRFLVGILVFLSMTFATNRQNLLYKFLRAFIELVLTLGLQIVYLFRKTLDSFSRVSRNVREKRNDREYITQSIGELRETSSQLTEAINSLAQDVAILGKMQTDLLIELRRMKRDSCGSCTCGTSTKSAEELEEVKKYYDLVTKLKDSTDNLSFHVNDLEKEVK
jgi:hypothetical protein